MLDSSQKRLIITNCLLYPYEKVHGPFIFRSGFISPILENTVSIRVDGLSDVYDNVNTYSVKGAASDVEFDKGNLVAVIASGSNDSPSILKKKLNAFGLNRDVIVLKGFVKNYEVVYSAHISPTGSVPATLHWTARGFRHVSVLFCDSAVLRALGASESLGENYFVAHTNSSIKFFGQNQVKGALFYGSMHGVLLKGDSYIPLPYAGFVRRNARGLTQREIQNFIHDLLHYASTMGDFIVQNALDTRHRARVNSRLKSSSAQVALGPEASIKDGDDRV